MGNHNILITNPQGERRHQFIENTSRDECRDWLIEYGPAPIGWNYQLINLNKKKRKYPECVLVQGFTQYGELVEQRKARVHTSRGWYTVRMAKRDLLKMGASYFTKEKVWQDAADKSKYQTELLPT